VRTSIRSLSNILFTIFFLFFFVGCQKRSTRTSQVLLREREARLTDIPIVLGSRPVANQSTKTAYVYDLRVDVLSIEQFYLREMERFGWRLLAKSRASGTLLVFQKPVKICVVSVQRFGSKTRVRIESMASGFAGSI